MSPRYSNLEKSNFMAAFAVKLKRAREVLGLSQSDLARELNVDVSSIQKWEGEQNLPGVVYYERARELFKRARAAKLSGKSVRA